MISRQPQLYDFSVQLFGISVQFKRVTGLKVLTLFI